MEPPPDARALRFWKKSSNDPRPTSAGRRCVGALGRRRVPSDPPLVALRLPTGSLPTSRLRSSAGGRVRRWWVPVALAALCTADVFCVHEQCACGCNDCDSGLTGAFAWLCARESCKAIRTQGQR